MTIPEEGFPLRVYVGESDRHGPIYGKDSAFVRGGFDGSWYREGSRKGGEFLSRWMEDHGRIGDVGTNKSFLVQRLTARSREGPELSLPEEVSVTRSAYLNQ